MVPKGGRQRGCAFAKQRRRNVRERPWRREDYAEALKWYRKAAEQGYPLAQSNLGGMYANGLGVAQDYTEAVDWYRKAAEQDDPAGEVNLLVQCMNAGLVLNKTTPR